MGGSSSKQEVTAKKQLTNYANDEKIRETAQLQRKAIALVAYEKQKSIVEERSEEIKKRTKEEKTLALAEQEQALQERIDKAAAEMEKAMKQREAAAAADSLSAGPIQVRAPPAPPVVDTTQVSRAPGVMSPRPQPSMSRQPGETQMLGMRNEQNKALETPVSSRSKPNGDDEDQKMQELKRLRAEAKAYDLEQQRQRQAQLNQNPTLVPEQAAPRQQQPDTAPRFDQDSGDENNDDVNEMSDVRRSMPGQPVVQMAKAQISTIQYAKPVKSPRNVYAPDLVSSMNSRGAASLQRNQQVIMLGMNEADQGDAEAQRNRNINLSDLQSLLV